MNDDSAAEYHGLRATIRERGTVRICVVTVGLIAMGALVIALLGRTSRGRSHCCLSLSWLPPSKSTSSSTPASSESAATFRSSTKSAPAPLVGKRRP